MGRGATRRQRDNADENVGIGMSSRRNLPLGILGFRMLMDI